MKQAAEQDGSGRGRWRPADALVLVGCVGAADLSVFLMIESLGADALPPGCGAGSGCGKVLSSSYADLWGLPVSLFAAATHVAMGVLWVMRRRGAGGGGRWRRPASRCPPPRRGSSTSNWLIFRRSVPTA